MEPPLSVSAFTSILKKELEGAHPFVHIQGEASNCKAQSSGHWYFSLKDLDAQISCVMFRLDAQKAERMIKDGDQVIIRGALNLYPPSGKYQIVVREIRQVGLGALLLQIEALKKKLGEEGLFDPKRKKPIPKVPKTICVISSPTGAVIQDIIHVLQRRLNSFHLVLIPTKVQGQGASEEIVEAIQIANQYKVGDVIILARGGGSFEDLFCFNEEKVARAISASTIPLISAIGHETDFTIADFVSDFRAPTPSAAAEIVSQEASSGLKQLTLIREQLLQKTSSILTHYESQLSNMKKHPFFASPYAILGPRMQKLDTFMARLEKENPFIKIPFQKKNLLFIQKSLDQTITALLLRKKRELERLYELKIAIDPKRLFERGFACVFSKKEGKLIKSVKELGQDSVISLSFADGDADAKIIGIYPS